MVDWKTVKNNRKIKGNRKYVSCSSVNCESGEISVAQVGTAGNSLVWKRGFQFYPWVFYHGGILSCLGLCRFLA